MPLTHFFIALSFLSRLSSGREVTEAEMAASVKWYPIAGLLIGLVLAFPFALGLAEGKPLLQGILFAAFYIWIIRALHWDGLADLFDALGSGRHGDEFRAVMKDSRIGVFGVVAIVVGLLAFTVGATYSLELGRWPLLVWAIVMGRSVVSLLACIAPPAEGRGLGSIVYEGSDGPAVPLAIGLALLLGFLCAGFLSTLVVFFLSGGILWWLSNIAGREGGISGDYFGAAIVLTEICALLVPAWLS